MLALALLEGVSGKPNTRSLLQVAFGYGAHHNNRIQTTTM